MANYCEDYPCCGHTDGLGCDWTYTPAAQEFDAKHFGCEHEMGYCEVYDECDEDHQCGDCGKCVDACVCEDRDEGLEDQWLDGSYEE